ncbi:MAG: STAS domain-containing protein [Defluviitaleaceae bacterium]|nr:STAS domain-containing protein [Defluviitaleaceae bacterium]
MKIVKTQDGDKTTFALAGRLDTSSAPQLQEQLIPELGEANTVVLDFAELGYVSSAGLRVLILGQKTAKAKGSKQTLVNVSSDIMEVFEMTGFSSVLHIE